MTIKVSECGARMHHVRNGLQSIMGLLYDIPDSPAKKALSQQLERISEATKECGINAIGCSKCKNGQGVQINVFKKIA
mgnify:CR=1 FL=1